MKIKIFLTSLLLTLFIANDLLAQRTSIPRNNQTNTRQVVESDGFTKENLFIEPQVGFNISNQFTQFSLTPYIGYSFNRNIAAGFGGGYSFLKVNGREDKQKQWQASIFAEAQIIGEDILRGSRLYLRGEFGRVSVKQFGVNEWISETILPLGGGLRMGAGRVTLINFNVMYNILYRQEESVLQSPLIYQPSIRWYFMQGK